MDENTVTNFVKLCKEMHLMWHFTMKWTTKFIIIIIIIIKGEWMEQISKSF